MNVPRLSKHLVRRYLGPKQLPKRPSEQAFGRLWFLEGFLFTMYFFTSQRRCLNQQLPTCPHFRNFKAIMIKWEWNIRKYFQDEMVYILLLIGSWTKNKYFNTTKDCVIQEHYLHEHFFTMVCLTRSILQYVSFVNNIAICGKYYSYISKNPSTQSSNIYIYTFICSFNTWLNYII